MASSADIVQWVHGQVSNVRSGVYGWDALQVEAFVQTYGAAEVFRILRDFQAFEQVIIDVDDRNHFVTAIPLAIVPVETSRVYNQRTDGNDGVGDAEVLPFDETPVRYEATVLDDSVAVDDSNLSRRFFDLSDMVGSTETVYNRWAPARWAPHPSYLNWADADDTDEDIETNHSDERHFSDDGNSDADDNGDAFRSWFFAMRSIIGFVREFGNNNSTAWTLEETSDPNSPLYGMDPSQVHAVIRASLHRRYAI